MRRIRRAFVPAGDGTGDLVPSSRWTAAVARSFRQKPAGAYLDTASIGLVPDEVSSGAVDCFTALGAGTRGAVRWRAVTEQARIDLAAEFGVMPAEISFMASTGEAMNALARAICWRPGDEVVVLADDFPTVLHPWLALGDPVRVVQVRAAPAEAVAKLVAAIGPATRAVAVAHVSSTTGNALDLAALGAACHAAGALLICDGAQAAGCIPVDLSAVDFYIATGYKWLLAGFGIALVISKRGPAARLTPGLRGHANLPPSASLGYGTVNLAGIYALAAAGRLRRSIGTQAIQARIAELVGRLYAELVDLGFRPALPSQPQAGIVSLAGFPEPDHVVADLASAGVSVAQRGGLLRIAPGLYTTDDEVDLLLGKVRAHRPSVSRTQ